MRRWQWAALRVSPGRNKVVSLLPAFNFGSKNDKQNLSRHISFRWPRIGGMGRTKNNWRWTKHLFDYVVITFGREIIFTTNRNVDQQLIKYARGTAESPTVYSKSIQKKSSNNTCIIFHSLCKRKMLSIESLPQSFATLGPPFAVILEHKIWSGWIIPA